jgi:hypothetical protein
MRERFMRALDISEGDAGTHDTVVYFDSTRRKSIYNNSN